MTTNILRRWDDVMALREGKKILPSFVTFHTSNVCNQHCVGCAHDGGLGGEMMSETNHLKIVDELRDVGVKAFDFAGGGEPTMLPYLPALMRHISRFGGYFDLLTNGLVMSEELVNALVSGGTLVRISLEASSRKEYAAYKRVDPRHWDIVLTNILKLRNAKETQHSDLEISIKFSVGRSLRGRQHYERCIELGRMFGARHVTIKALRHQPEELPESDRITEQAILRDVIFQEHAEDLVSSWIAPLDPARIPHCYLTPTQTVVDYAGDVYACCYYYNGRHDEMKIGNMLRERFQDFWMDGHHRTLLAKIDFNKCLENDCKMMKHLIAIDQAANRGHVEWL